MEMCLSCALCISDALLDDGLGFFDVLAVQINGVRVYLADCIVLAEDKFRGLLVVVVGRLSMLFTLLGHLVCAATISARICLLRLDQL